LPRLRGNDGVSVFDVGNYGASALIDSNPFDLPLKFHPAVFQVSGI
jgi:hypothetical protein